MKKTLAPYQNFRTISHKKTFLLMNNFLLHCFIIAFIALIYTFNFTTHIRNTLLLYLFKRIIRKIK